MSQKFVKKSINLRHKESTSRWHFTPCTIHIKQLNHAYIRAHVAFYCDAHQVLHHFRHYFHQIPLAYDRHNKLRRCKSELVQTRSPHKVRKSQLAYSLIFSSPFPRYQLCPLSIEFDCHSLVSGLPTATPLQLPIIDSAICQWRTTNL
jgi:hypothetical protein